MKKISVIIAHRHATSFTLEDEFYAALKEIAKFYKTNITRIVTEIDKNRGDQSLSSALRVYILQQIRKI